MNSATCRSRPWNASLEAAFSEVAAQRRVLRAFGCTRKRSRRPSGVGPGGPSGATLSRTAPRASSAVASTGRRAPASPAPPGHTGSRRLPGSRPRRTWNLGVRPGRLSRRGRSTKSTAEPSDPHGTAPHPGPPLRRLGTSSPRRPERPVPGAAGGGIEARAVPTRDPKFRHAAERAGIRPGVGGTPRGTRCVRLCEGVRAETSTRCAGGVDGARLKKRIDAAAGPAAHAGTKATPPRRPRGGLPRARDVQADGPHPAAVLPPGVGPAGRSGTPDRLAWYQPGRWPPMPPNRPSRPPRWSPRSPFPLRAGVRRRRGRPAAGRGVAVRGSPRDPPVAGTPPGPSIRVPRVRAPGRNPSPPSWQGQRKRVPIQARTHTERSKEPG